jgi:AmmeMemoRadiSam system protein B
VEKPKIRKPAVAGQFYPADAAELRRQIESFVDKSAEKTDVVSCMLPHAGYIYSGKVAVEAVSRINIKDTVILLGPNHTGYGTPFSMMAKGVWQTPLGDVSVDDTLAGQILKNSKYIEADDSAHLYEHSLEVELPILQYFKPDFKIVPLTVLADDLAGLRECGREIGTAVKASGRQDSVLIVASSDMTHYEPQQQAEKKDREAIEAILDLDEEGLMQKIRRLNISMCGFAPAIIMLSAAKVLGAKSGRLVKYQTSGDVTKDFESVVGYAGIIIT